MPVQIEVKCSINAKKDNKLSSVIIMLNIVIVNRFL